MSYAAHLVVYFGIYTLAAMSLNLVVGWLGLMSLAHAVFVAIGAYTAAILSVGRGVDPWLALPVGMTFAALAAIPLALAADRFRGGFFILVSLAFQVIAYSAMRNAYSMGEPVGSLANLTNGVFGVAGVPRPAIGDFMFDTPLRFACLSLAFCVGGVVLCHRRLHSPWGRMLRAIRDDELAARSLGKSVQRARVQVFMLSAVLAAVAGWLYAGYVSYVDANIASLDECIFLLAMVVVGGSGNIRGTLVGVALLMAVAEVLRLLPLADADAGALRVLLYGLLLLVVVCWRPQGIAGEYRVQ